MPFNAELGMAGSYYAATAHPAPARPALDQDMDIDLAVVGGGCTGLSAALHAARQGLTVALLEGGRLGWGASGRNGGQMIPGLRLGAAELIVKLGEPRARDLLRLSLEARDLVLDVIRTYGIECDLKLTGHVTAAAKASDLTWMSKDAEALDRVLGYRQAEVLDRSALRAHVRSDFHGGLLDAGGGHMHPLNYALGLAAAAEHHGARLFENSPATRLSRAGSGVRLQTDKATVNARHVILAGDALLHGVAPAVERRIMPVANYVIATAPLDDPKAVLPSNAAVSDSRFVVNYFRLSADNRLIFGGGERYTTRPPADMAAFVRPHMERLFPQLQGVAIDHAWGGRVSITRTRLPHIGRDGPVLFAHGYSGLGVLLSTLGGKLLVEALAGDSGRFDRFAALAPPAFPGGALLRGPLHVLGMLWYALRDRL